MMDRVADKDSGFLEKASNKVISAFKESAPMKIEDFSFKVGPRSVAPSGMSWQFEHGGVNRHTWDLVLKGLHWKVTCTLSASTGGRMMLRAVNEESGSVWTEGSDSKFDMQTSSPFYNMKLTRKAEKARSLLYKSIAAFNDDAEKKLDDHLEKHTEATLYVAENDQNFLGIKFYDYTTAIEIPLSKSVAVMVDGEVMVDNHKKGWAEHMVRALIGGYISFSTPLKIEKLRGNPPVLPGPLKQLEKKMSAITERLDRVATYLEPVRPDLALALDRVSDRLDEKSAAFRSKRYGDAVPTGEKEFDPQKYAREAVAAGRSVKQTKPPWVQYDEKEEEQIVNFALEGGIEVKTVYFMDPDLPGPMISVFVYGSHFNEAPILKNPPSSAKGLGSLLQDLAKYEKGELDFSKLFE